MSANEFHLLHTFHRLDRLPKFDVGDPSIIDPAGNKSKLNKACIIDETDTGVATVIDVYARQYQYDTQAYRVTVKSERMTCPVCKMPIWLNVVCKAEQSGYYVGFGGCGSCVGESDDSGKSMARVVIIKKEKILRAVGYLNSIGDSRNWLSGLVSIPNSVICAKGLVIFRSNINCILICYKWSDIIKGIYDKPEQLKVPESLSNHTVADLCITKSKNVAALWKNGAFCLINSDTKPNEKLIKECLDFH
jgi:hypothetical protein